MKFLMIERRKWEYIICTSIIVIIFMNMCCTQVSDETLGVQPDDLIMFLQLAGERDEVGENKYDVSLLTATGASGGIGGPGAAKGDKLKSQLNKVTEEWNDVMMTSSLYAG